MKDLSAEFNDLNIDASEKLAFAIGCLAQAVYMTDTLNIVYPGTDHKVLIVAVKGDPGAGKSVFSSNIVLKNVGGLEGNISHTGCSIRFEGSPDGSEPERICSSWESYWSLETMQQNRVQDSFTIVGPYACNEGIAERFTMEDRIAPGLEIIEHPFMVPPEDIGLNIAIEVQDNNLRKVIVSTRGSHGPIDEIWKEFLEFSRS